MSAHHHQEGNVIKSFPLTAILSFATIFCLFTLLSNCHGPYQPPSSGHHEAAGHKTEQKHDAKPAEGKPENHAPASSHH